MNYAPKYAMQVGGDIRRWSNPERTFHSGLLKLDLACEADPYPGILILTNPTYASASAMAVKNLRKELPKLIEHLDEGTIAYWYLETNEKELSRVLAGLTAAPIFADILG